MVKKSQNNEENGAEGNDRVLKGTDTAFNIIDRNISAEMRESYLDYAMSVITSRALPDVKDGLKPVHRRILYAMNEMGLNSSAKFRKSAAVVGDVLGKYHPHGDISVYDAMVKMGQIFSHRYPLIIGQGNYGSIDGDPPAAMRYTEAKMSKLSAELLKDLDKDTVEWRPNYDSTRKEPIVLPAAVPNLLLNGTLGIAVGMATNIPPHNLREVVESTIHLIENPDATVEDLMEFVKGPDFPTGGLVFNKEDLRQAYTHGKGGVVCRGEAEIIEQKAGATQIIISSLPYRVNKAELVARIAELVRDKKIEGIKGLRDESAKGDIRVAIDLKGGVHAQNILNLLYKHTPLEDTFHYNMVALVDSVPQTLSLKGILQEFVLHRQSVVRRRTEFDLRKAEEREHILLGLKKALDHIDEIIKLIRAAKDVPTAHAALMREFKFSDRQTTAILEMRLQRLAALERKKIEEELSEVQKLIAYLKDLLSSPKKILAVIKTELNDIVVRYGDDRRTKILGGGAKIISMEDTIADEESVLVLTSGGYIKRTNPDEYKKQKRGGVGVIDLDTKEEDFVTIFLTATNHSDLLFFSDKGKVYQIKMYEVPEGKRATRGKSVMNFLSLSSDEKVTSILAMPKAVKGSATALVMVTREGIAKKVSIKDFSDVRRSGLIAIKLHPSDELISAQFVDKGEEIILGTSKGQAIRFKESTVREMGRTAAGVRAMKLSKGDFLIGADIVKKDDQDAEFFVITSNGYGKKTPLKEYKIQGRGGSGIKTVKVTPKTGTLIASKVLTSTYTEIVAISKKSQVIRTGIDEVSSLGRQTQGVRIMRLREGDSIASLTCL
jgi:DNA gyrase subunit A